MNTIAKQLLTSSRTWLQSSVFPLWTAHGIDPTNGSFVEALSAEGLATQSPRRAMVQARQIFSYSEALKMDLLTHAEVMPILEKSTQFLLSRYSSPTGAFIHAVTPNGAPENSQNELYTQAFVLFGLARSFEVLKTPHLKERALKLVSYLNSTRRAPNGGYTEIKNDKTLFQSNPHMHLFEAALEWARVDSDLVWKDLCHQIFELCRTRFIDRNTGALCEHFDETWQPLRENGLFFFEPGHHYEWAWLMVRFQNMLSTDTGGLPTQLFALAEAHGFGLAKGFAVDEVWSNFRIKKDSARFWPQTERVKAAVLLGLQAPASQQSRFAAAADEAMTTLWKYLDSPAKGLWQDTRTGTGEFVPQAPKASSLYHIINAISEYADKRPSLQD